MHYCNIFRYGHRVKIQNVLLSLLLMVLISGPVWGDTGQKIVPGSSPKTVIIGHRGAAGLAPENTLAAFSKAIASGADGVELDVLLSADGELVVHHDFALKPEIARGPDGKWMGDTRTIHIKDLSLAQLKSYDVGRLKPGTSYARKYPEQQSVDGQRIPTLQQVMYLLREKTTPDFKLLIEIKTSPEKPLLTPPPETVADAVVEIVRRENFVSRTLILSFDWRALAHVQKLAPEIPTVYLTSQHKPLKPFNKSKTLLWTAGLDPADYDGSLIEMIQAAGGRHWAEKYGRITAHLVQQAHEAGIRVYAWTVDSKSDMRQLIQMGVDGIITNRPDLLTASDWGQLAQ